MKLAGVLGWPITHSRSPAIHNAAYRALGLDAIYLPLAVTPERLPEAIAGLRALGFVGANVTVPHKQAAMALCDDLDPAAIAVGAVNTVIVAADGRLIGYNTDVEGFEHSLADLAARPTRAVVLGAGGAARAVVRALRGMNVHSAVVARYPARAKDLLALGAAEIAPWRKDALAAVLAGADLLVDATSLGLSDRSEATAPDEIPLDTLADHALVCTLVYHRDTALLAAARARGLRTRDGAEMLVRQAARAFELMTGHPAPLEVMRAALRPAAPA